MTTDSAVRIAVAELYRELPSGTPIPHLFDSLSDAGMIRVTDYGEENVYFEFKDAEGTVRNGYCKCL